MMKAGGVGRDGMRCGRGSGGPRAKKKRKREDYTHDDYMCMDGVTFLFTLSAAFCSLSLSPSLLLAFPSELTE